MTLSKKGSVSSSGGGSGNLTISNSSTGIISGGVVTLVDSTHIGITAATGQIVDNSDPTSPVFSQVSFAGDANYLVENPTTDGVFLIALDTDSQIVELSFFTLTTQNRHELILLGAYVTVVAAGGVAAILDEPLNVGYSASTAATDFIWDVIGPANVSGNVISPNGTNLSIDNSGGITFILGQNFRQDQDIPNHRTIPAAPKMTFTRTFRGTGGMLLFDAMGATFDVIDPTRYDDGSGTLQAVNNNNYTVQVVFIAPDGFYTVAFGQEQFNTLSAAEDAILNGSLQFEEVDAYLAQVRRLFIVVKKEATDLSNVAQAVFFHDGKFRGEGLSSTSNIPTINTPGGSNEDIQFNSAGTFSGSSDLTWDGSTLGVIGSVSFGETGSFYSLEIGDAGGDSLAISTKPLDALAQRSLLIGRDTATQGGRDVVAVGHSAAAGTTTANNITALGNNALAAVTRSSDSTAVGFNALKSLTGISAFDNAAFGSGAGQDIADGSGNTILGRGAARDKTGGSNTVFVGAFCGLSSVSGDNLIIIGAGADVPNGTISNFVNIGDFLRADLDEGRMTIGDPGAGVQAPLFAEGVQLDLTDKNKVMRFNRLNNAQENSLPTLTDGVIWYNSDAKQFRVQLNNQTMSIDVSIVV